MQNELANMSEASLNELELNLKEEAKTISDIRDCLERGEKGGIRQSLSNCVYALQHDPILGGAIRRNELNCRIDIVGKMPPSLKKWFFPRRCPR